MDPLPPRRLADQPALRRRRPGAAGLVLRGPGQIGEDAANLVLDTFFDGLVDVALLPDVVEAVLDGYLAGLGKTVDPALVVGAVRLTGAAKYFWLAPVMLNRAGGGTGQTYDRRDEAAMFAGRLPVLELLARWSAEALG